MTRRPSPPLPRSEPPPSSPHENLSIPEAVDGETAVEALRRSEAYFRALVENARDVIHVINEDRTTRYVTPSVKQLLGWEPAEVVGRSAVELVHPDDVAPAMEQIRLSREKPGAGRPLTLRVRHRDGSWRVFEAIGRNLLDDPRVRGIIVNSRDVTERRRAEEQSLRLAAFARENPNPIFELSPDGAVVWVNAAGQRLVAARGVSGPAGVLPDDHAALLRQAAEGTATRGQEVRVGSRVFAWSYHPQPSLGTVHLFGEEVTERKQVEERLLHDAVHDALTGLPNRHLFMQRLGESLFRFNQGGGQFAVLFLDLDRFKVVNDSLGHHVGDELLVAVARRLQESVRTGDTVARFGGDEFAILLRDLDDTADATTIATRVADAVAAPVNLSGYEVFTSVSIGIALASNGYERPEYLLRGADMAMYQAKGSAGLAFEVFDRGMHARALTRLQMETDLRRALQRGEFRLHYQPIISLSTGRIAGVEALARWEHPDRGLVAPAEFIAMAEETGAIVQLGEWVVREACRQLAAWRAELGVAIAVSVNLSARQIAQPGLVEVVRAALEAAGLAPADLKLEITESALLETAAAESVLAELRALGVEMQLDDFGTGYSSLSALHRLPMQALKVDRTFVSRMEAGSASSQLVRTIALMARGMELTVIAEGVETAAQLAEVREIGCDYAQGYLISRPLPADALRELLVSEPVW
ncbi:MAG TPA: EAL domain-containing protein [Longimicrobium sp.]|nr:EAL domain-containing protein [Longimicrobium sp.]